MIKSDSQTAQANKKDLGNQECWHNEPNTSAVRFELEGRRMAVLPYLHFTSAWFDATDDEDSITVNFSSHELVIKGHELMKLFIAFQKQTVEWVKMLPKRHEKLLEREGGFVTGIEVRELTEGADDPDSSEDDSAERVHS